MVMTSWLIGLRQRTAPNKGPEDFDELITHHQKLHDKIAEEMLILTQNLKGQSEIANRIIKKDTEVGFSEYLKLGLK